MDYRAFPVRIQALEMGPGITYTRKNRACPFFKSGVSSIGSEYFPSTSTFPHGSIRESIYLLDFVILHERKKGGSILIGVLRESKYIYIEGKFENSWFYLIGEWKINGWNAG